MNRILAEQSLKKLSMWVGLLITVAWFVSSCSKISAPKMASVKVAEQPAGAFGFVLPKVDPAHPRMVALLKNAFAYIDPKHDIVDAASGYLVEGWNQDPERDLFLRSFTQITAIGQWIELLANIAAGYADNPYISREQALERLGIIVTNLRQDQQDPKVSAIGLLSNFLGLEGGRRIGPLAWDVAKQDVVDVFGKVKTERIWAGLKEEGWIKAENDDQIGVIQRDETYGLKHFEGTLKEAVADDGSREKLMGIMDERIVMIVYGDNANLAASVAKAIGALLSPSVRDLPESAALRATLEAFLDAQEEGYRFLFDKEAGMLHFGWNASTRKYFGWEDCKGNWKIGHSDYLVNEFRGPTMFVLLRYDMPEAIYANLGFKIKPYRLENGALVHALAPWEGSAFQALGLSLFMQELDNPAWRRLLETVVDIELDYAARNNLPGLLSESYSGDESEYSGSLGIPEITVSPTPRITDAPSLYTLGVAYRVAPEKVERLLEDQWSIISTLLTDHGPWEGYKTSTGEAIDIQITAHVLSLILGGIGTASENMGRYLDSRGLGAALQALYASAEPANLLVAENQFIGWSSDSSPIVSSRGETGFRLQGDDLGEVGITIVLAEPNGVNLSGGKLKIRYESRNAIEKAVIKLDKKNPALSAAGVIGSAVYTQFAATEGGEGELEITLPATPGLRGIRELVIQLGDNKNRVSVDLLISGVKLTPAADGRSGA